MNRIILIGNGFDLAHGLKTSYREFIDDYWCACLDEFNKLQEGTEFINNELKIAYRPTEIITANSYKEIKKAFRYHNIKINYKNLILRVITEKSDIENWVDVENEYYLLLKSLLDNKIENPDGYDIRKLNLDFDNVKNLLVKYLKGQEDIYRKDKGSNFVRIKDHIFNKAYGPFKIRDFSEKSLNAKVEIEYKKIKNDLEGLKGDEVGRSYMDINEICDRNRKIINEIHEINKPKSEIKSLLSKSNAHDLFDLVPNNILFLNFNYTSTDKLYQNSLEYSSYLRGEKCEVDSIQIHGALDAIDENPVIFGFGDELDDDYQAIEKLNNNLFLENIKSINYLETDNYKRLLEYINGAPFQVFIFGHSCGTSDRTMLNTMFEHDNCASIKLFYHQKEDGQDNYSDVIRNISRNFNDKAKMRDRVVNKTYCEKLV